MPEKKQTILAKDDTESNIDTLLEIPVAEEEQTIAAVDDVENNIDSLLEILIPDKKQTILVVDDTEIDIDVLLEILSNDYIVRVAADGESALDSVKDSLPDLILLDVLMPGLHGFEVCYRLKANRSTQSIPVIFITSLAEVQDETHGLELGAVDYITKPFNPAIVRARIKNHLELKRHRDVMALLMARKSRELIEAYNRLKIIKEIEIEFHTAFSHKLDALTKSLLGISDLALWNMQEEWRSNEDTSRLNLPAESMEISEASLPMQEMSKKNLLIVDDTEINVEVLLSTLNKDYNVRVAMDGLSALRAVDQNLPDLILLDVVMPGMDGFEVCRRLKENNDTKDIPVIFLTSLCTPSSKGKGLALGAVDYISMPFNPELIKARIRNHLDLKAHRDNLEELVKQRIHAKDNV